MADTTNGELTPAQETELLRWRDEWLARGMSTERADRPKAEAAITAMYEQSGQPAPTFLWTDSPYAALKLIAAIKAAPGEFSRKAVRKIAQDTLKEPIAIEPPAQPWEAPFSWGCHEVAWIAFYRFREDVLGVEYAQSDHDQLARWEQYASAACWCWTFQGLAICSERPTAYRTILRQTEDGPMHTLHDERQASIEFADGYKVFCWRGILVPHRIITAPETITATEIQKEANAEIARIMFERFEALHGEGSFVKALGAKSVQKDDFGELFRVKRAEDSDIVMVKVQNSTPEPDGTYKDYWLRCHPELRPMRENGQLGEPQEDRALNAVASTFGMYGHEYAPVAQT